MLDLVGNAEIPFSHNIAQVRLAKGHIHSEKTQSDQHLHCASLRMCYIRAPYLAPWENSDCSWLVITNMSVCVSPL